MIEIFRNPNYDFIGKRKWAYYVSIAFTLIAIISLVAHRGRFEPFPLTARWRDVDAIDDETIHLRVRVDGLIPGRVNPGEQEFWVGQVLLDRQIVDTAGAVVPQA